MRLNFVSLARYFENFDFIFEARFSRLLGFFGVSAQLLQLEMVHPTFRSLQKSYDHN